MTVSTGKEQPGPFPKTKPFAKHGPQVTSIGFGCMGLSGAHGKQKPDSERFALLDHIYQAGECFWDTSDIYGDNEELLGNWFARNPGAREKVFLCTKFGNCRDAQTGQMSVRNDAAYIVQQCNKSLQRLKTDYIDLYYMHRADVNQPIEITVRTMKELQDAGKVKYLGLSEVSADTLRRACKIAHIDAVQMEYSPFSLEIEREGLLSACQELNVAIVAYAPLGKGFLTGTIRSHKDVSGDARSLFPRFHEENFYKNLELVDKLAQIADRKKCTSSQLTLAWLTRSNPLVFPIPGTTRIDNFNDNFGALNVNLTEAEDQEMRNAISSAKVEGSRYPEAFMSNLFVNTAPL